MPFLKQKKILFLILFSSLFFTGRIEAGSLRETPVVAIVKKCSPSVVNISTEQIIFLKGQPVWDTAGDIFDELFEDFFQTQTVSALELQSLGSGVIVDPSGLIVTNAHVVHMARRIFIVFSDGAKVQGKLLGIDQVNDLALLQVEPPFSLQALPLADSEAVMTGETVVAIGNPYGLENSVTSGIVSGKNRTFNYQNSQVFQGLIQTDAPINFGSSGGALLNLDGELIGLNLAVVEHAQNIGFAVSSQKIKDLLDAYRDRQPITVTARRI